MMVPSCHSKVASWTFSKADNHDVGPQVTGYFFGSALIATVEKDSVLDRVEIERSHIDKGTH